MQVDGIAILWRALDRQREPADRDAGTVHIIHRGTDGGRRRGALVHHLVLHLAGASVGGEIEREAVAVQRVGGIRHRDRAEHAGARIGAGRGGDVGGGGLHAHEDRVAVVVGGHLAGNVDLQQLLAGIAAVDHRAAAVLGERRRGGLIAREQELAVAVVGVGQAEQLVV